MINHSRIRAGSFGSIINCGDFGGGEGAIIEADVVQKTIEHLSIPGDTGIPGRGNWIRLDSRA